MNNNYQEKPYVRVAVLVSGGGTNLQALIDAEREGALHSGRICLVISDRNDAYALERARIAGIESAIVVWRTARMRILLSKGCISCWRKTGLISSCWLALCVFCPRRLPPPIPAAS